MEVTQKIELDFKGKKTIALVGNPNVGKSVVFALLTGKYVTVSNYPGTTVEVTQGFSVFDRKNTVIVDTPGVNSLIPQSEDERVARDILLDETPRVVVQIADAKNLKRSLLLTLQLIEMGLPLVLDLNIYDEAQARGIKIDTEKLKNILGIETVRTVATEKTGIEFLLKAIHEPAKSDFKIDYGDLIEDSIGQISALLAELPITKRAASILLLSKDATFENWLINRGLETKKIELIRKISSNLEAKLNRPTSYLLTLRQHRVIEKITKEVMQVTPIKARKVVETIGRFLISSFWGGFFSLLVLYLVYQFVGKFGAGFLVDLLENKLFGKFFNPAVTRLADTILPWPIIKEALVGEYGLITMALTYAIAIIFPIVTTFFIVFGILEDTGYLPRLAALSNQLFKRIGLHGKAILPMILGLGCGTMATLTTRILETKKERIIATILIALAIPCSAQLGVILGMLAEMSSSAFLIWILTIMAIMSLVGIILDKVVPGKRSDFVIEIPPLRIPQISNILIKVGARLKWYLKEAVPLFFLGTFILFVSDKLGFLTLVEKFSSPIVVRFLGLPAKATEAFIIGFLRRDYGAAGLYLMRKNGLLSNQQVLVSLVTITLFIPCIAQFFVTIKERGMKLALLILVFVFSFAILVGGGLNWLLQYLRITL